MRLSRNVVVLSLVSLFQDAASEMLYPVMPLFLTGVLGAPVAAVGLIEGVAEATAAVGKAVSGRVSDAVDRRRPLVSAGYALSALSKLLIGTATAWPQVLVWRFVDRAGKGVRDSPRDALIAQDTAPSMRGRAFGFHRAFDTAGAVIGPLAGLALYEALGRRVRPVLFAAFVPAAISVALTGLVRERPVPRATAQRASHVSLPAAYKRTVALLTLFGLANFSDALLILRARALGLSFSAVILAYAMYNVVYSALSYPAGRLSDRIPRRIVFAVGLLVFAAAYAGLGLARDAWLVWVLLPLYGAYTALTDGVARAWVANLLPESSVGTGLGVYQGVTGISALIAGVWAGLLWGADGTRPFLISAAAAAVVGLVLLTRRA